MSTAPLDPAQIMVDHQPTAAGWCGGHHGQPAPFPIEHPCETYRLAEALTTERARVRRVEALMSDWLAKATAAEPTFGRQVISVGHIVQRVRGVLAGDTEGES